MGQANRGDPLPLAPPAAAIRLSQGRSYADTGPDGDGLDCLNFTDEFEFHTELPGRSTSREHARSAESCPHYGR